MSENTGLTASEFARSGRVNLDGMNMDLSVIIGKNIAEEYFKTISQDKLDAIFEYMTNETWQKEKNYLTGDCEMPEEVWKLKYSIKNSYFSSEKTPPSIAIEAKKELDKKLREAIFKRVEELIESQDYKDKVNNIAQEIIDFVSEGYKEELKKRITNKLIYDNTDHSGYFYGGIDLKGLVQQEIQNCIH